MIVVKIGGSILEKEHMGRICKEILELRAQGERIVLVHGGGRKIKEYEEKMGVPQSYAGRWRITDEQTLRILKMVAGETNIDLVSLLDGKGVGLSGASANVVIAEEKEYENKQWIGYVGRPKKINDKFLRVLLESGYIPVLSFIAKGEKEKSLNVNADELASLVAIKLKCDALVLLTDVDGVIVEEKVVCSVTPKEIRKLETGGGMKFKLEGALQSACAGIKTIIANGKKENAIRCALKGEGTCIVNDE